MKSIIRFLLLLSILPFTLNAQRSGQYTFGPWNGGTNNIALTSTNTVTDTAISVEEHDHIGIAVTLRPVSTSTGTVVFKFADKVGSYNESTATHTIIQPPAFTHHHRRVRCPSTTGPSRNLSAIGSVASVA